MNKELNLEQRIEFLEGFESVSEIYDLSYHEIIPSWEQGYGFANIYGQFAFVKFNDSTGYDFVAIKKSDEPTFQFFKRVILRFLRCEVSECNDIVHYYAADEPDEEIVHHSKEEGDFLEIYWLAKWGLDTRLFCPCQENGGATNPMTEFSFLSEVEAKEFMIREGIIGSVGRYADVDRLYFSNLRNKIKENGSVDVRMSFYN
jgi:hypothetical protein